VLGNAVAARGAGEVVLVAVLAEQGKVRRGKL